MRNLSGIYLAVTFLVCIALGGLSLPGESDEDPFGVALIVEPYAQAVCKGSPATLQLSADDYDYHYACEGFDDLSFGGWPGEPPVKWQDTSYYSTWTHTFDAVGLYEYDISADDAGICYDDPPTCPNDNPAHSACDEALIGVSSVTLLSPIGGMRFIVGSGECDVALIAQVNGYYPHLFGEVYSVTAWVRPPGKAWECKAALTHRVNGRFTGTWDTDGTYVRGDYQVKVRLTVNNIMQSIYDSQVVTVFCAIPTWPICRDEGTNGLIYQWLHLTGDDRGVDVDITGQGCTGTTPLLASEDGLATPHEFPPTVHFCDSMKEYNTLCNRVEYGEFNVELLDESAPAYRSRTLSTDHWHMMPTPARTSGAVSYHQSLGNGGYTGNVQGSHDHFITLVGGTGVSPDRTGVVGEGSYTDCRQMEPFRWWQLHPAW